MFLIVHFGVHIGFEGGEVPNQNGRSLLRMVFVADLAIASELQNCEGKWTWESGEKRSVVNYILVPQDLKKMIIEGNGQLDTGSDHT